MPHLVFQADPGYGVLSSRPMAGKITAGDHGWAPATPQMHGIFVAWGPQVGEHWPHGTMRAQEVHALMLELLGLAPP